jgi:hypothetical protein
VKVPPGTTPTSLRLEAVFDSGPFGGVLRAEQPLGKR